MTKGQNEFNKTSKYVPPLKKVQELVITDNDIHFLKTLMVCQIHFLT